MQDIFSQLDSQNNCCIGWHEIEMFATRKVSKGDLKSQHK